MQLSARLPDGATLREHLQATPVGRADPRLRSRVPAAGALLWEAFAALHTGMARMQPSEVLAWQQLHGVRLSSWDVDTLFGMDAAALNAAAAKKH